MKHNIAHGLSLRIIHQGLNGSNQFARTFLGEGKNHENARHHEKHVHGEQAGGYQLSQNNIKHKDKGEVDENNYQYGLQ